MSEPPTPPSQEAVCPCCEPLSALELGQVLILLGPVIHWWLPHPRPIFTLIKQQESLLKGLTVGHHQFSDFGVVGPQDLIFMGSGEAGEHGGPQ